VLLTIIREKEIARDLEETRGLSMHRKKAGCLADRVKVTDSSFVER
jgi:hypothetical protein